MTGRVWLPFIFGAALVAAAPAASAQAPAPPTKAQAMTVAGDVGRRLGRRARRRRRRHRAVRAHGRRAPLRGPRVRLRADQPFDCHWWVRVRVASGDTLAWRTIRRRSDDTECPSPLPAGPATMGQETVPPAGRLGPAPA